MNYNTTDLDTLLDPVKLYWVSGLTQAQLAELFGVSHSTFAKWCNRSARPRRWAWKKAAEISRSLQQQAVE